MEAAENSSAEQQLKTVIPAVIGSLSALVLMSIVFEHGKEKLVHFAKKRRLERIVTVLFGGVCGDILVHSCALQGHAARYAQLPTYRADTTWIHRSCNLYSAAG